MRELQLATLVDAPPAGDRWLHEPKLDGYRILAVKHGERVWLLSRRFNDWTDRMPSVARAVAALPAERAVLDGEAAVVQPDGRTSFQALQNALGTAADVSYFAFDLLAVDGDELARRPLEERKARLRALLADAGDGDATGPLRYTDHVVGRGAEVFAAACRTGLEGIVSKRRDLPYHPGRSLDWVKVKCLQRQELVIGGFTEPEGSRVGIGALLVGHVAGGKLVYAGKVGTGFDNRTLVALRRRLDPLLTTTSPFEPPPPRAWTGPARWVRPELVAEVAFTEWTADGRLRHPSFKGLRDDKRAADVVRERPAAAPAGAIAGRAPRRTRAARPARSTRPRTSSPHR